MIKDTKDDSLPKIKTPTKAEQELIDAEQAKRAKMVTITTSGSQIAFARAASLIRSLEPVPYAELTPKAQKDYVDSLSIVGRFDKAYELTGDDTYLEIWNAVQGKAKKCKCEPVVENKIEAGRPKQIRHSTLFVRKQVYSIKDGQFHDLVMCNKCKNITL